jgi:16S rRNA A1518/A1519 N6-dimethyltransferase RsmA/KsgA/DIM1 with predicted DNA glycosylase/AP lyase activity
LRNNFKGSADDAVLTAAGLDPSARAESLSIEQLIALALRIESTHPPKAP